MTIGQRGSTKCLSAVLTAWMMLSATAATAEVRLPAVFGDHMVLQQRTSAPLWGWAQPGQRIRVHPSWMDRPLPTTAGRDGAWRVALPTPSAGGPFTIAIRSTAITAGNTPPREHVYRLEDVLVGEVWICSGQSNMEMPVGRAGPGYSGVIEYERELAAADHPQVRLFTVERAFALEPEADCAGVWQRCRPESVAEFSAVGYFFGRELQERLDVPIGLICAAWGGTPAEVWTSRTGLERLPSFADALEEMDALRVDPDAFADRHAAEMVFWRELGRLFDPGLRQTWMDESFNDDEWDLIEVPGVWTGEDLRDFDGAVWFRRTVKLPESWAGRNLTISLGPIDDWDQTWFNGISIGMHDSGVQWQTPRLYQVSGEYVHAGENTITVRVIDTGGEGGFRGERGQLTIARSGSDEAPISLAGRWRYQIGPTFAEFPPQPKRKTVRPALPGALYNGMIAPLVPYGIRGAVWYQGESNRYDPEGYRTLFPTMIESWREAWGRGDFPFYYVQIAPFEYRHHGELPSEATAELREAQLLTLRVPNTGMAVTLDVGNPRDIHPRNKKPVGDRLARWALAQTYGRDLVYSGPLYRSMQVEGDRLRVFFDHVGSGLIARGEGLGQFEIAGEDGTFVPAGARIDGESVVVWSDDVEKPTAARYAWSDAPIAGLFNKEGLPASPFRTGGETQKRSDTETQE